MQLYGIRHSLAGISRYRLNSNYLSQGGMEFDYTNYRTAEFAVWNCVDRESPNMVVCMERLILTGSQILPVPCPSGIGPTDCGV